MLFTDNDFVSSSDLQSVDGTVPKVVAALGITIDGDVGLMRQVLSECGDRLQSQMESFGALAPIGVSDLHIAAVMNNVWTSGQLPRVRLGQINTTSLYANFSSELRTWVIYEGLVKLYEDAFSRNAEDRYEKKLELYTKRAKDKWLMMTKLGLPCVFVPFPCPGAVHEPQSGKWGSANVTSVAGGSNGSESVFVAITYVDTTTYISPVKPMQAESAPSAVLPFAIPANQLLKIDLAGLIAPNGPLNVGYSMGIWQRRPANAFNVYVGTSESALYLQNSSPVQIPSQYLQGAAIPAGAVTYTLAGAPATTGPTVGTGQNPDTRVVFRNPINRG